jgi:hypothetical protein
LVESGVEENERREESRCERTVVFPDPDSPLKKGHQHTDQKRRSERQGASKPQKHLQENK